MTFPTFVNGDPLGSSDLNAVGLWLVKTQAVGSGAATIDVTGCFDSTYQNYRVSYTGGVGSANLNLNLQFLIGTTPTASNYFGGRGYFNVGGGTWQVGVDNGTTSFTAGSASTVFALVAIDVQLPNVNGPTFANGPYNRLDNGLVGHGWTHQTSTSQFTGFRLTTSTGTVSGGTIRVYGYRD
jgi:hypothetical protein